MYFATAKCTIVYNSRFAAVTMPQEKPRLKPFFIILPRGTSMSDLSGPITMSATVSKKMCLIQDDESMVSSEYIELIMKLFCFEL